MNWSGDPAGMMYDPYGNLWQKLSDGKWYSDAYRWPVENDPRTLNLPPPDQFATLGFEEQFRVLGMTEAQISGTLEQMRQDMEASSGGLEDLGVMLAAGGLMGGMAAGAGVGAAPSSTSGFGFGSPESLVGADLGGTTLAAGGGGMDSWTDLLNVSDAGDDVLWSASEFTPTTFDNFGVLDSLTLTSISDALRGLNAGVGLLGGGESGGGDFLSKLLGALVPAGIGAFGASQQSDALKELAESQRAAEEARYQDLVKREEARYGDIKSREDARLAQQRQDIEFARNLGAPYRDQLAGLLRDPSSFLRSAGVQESVQQGTDAVSRALSAKVGNPYGNPTALGEIQGYATNNLYGQLGNELTRLGALGGLTSYGGAGATIPGINTNLPTTATAGSNIGTGAGNQAMLGSIGQDTNMWNALGAGAANLFNPQPTLESLLKSMTGAGNIFKVGP